MRGFTNAVGRATSVLRSWFQRHPDDFANETVLELLRQCRPPEDATAATLVSQITAFVRV
jgi:hypothetical protein